MNFDSWFKGRLEKLQERLGYRFKDQSKLKTALVHSSHAHEKGLLEGMPVREGDRVRTNLFGARICDFRVMNTAPGGSVIISKSTYVNVEKQPELEKKEKISYEDIGGLGPQIQRIREMIELPLRRFQDLST